MIKTWNAGSVQCEPVAVFADGWQGRKGWACSEWESFLLGSGEAFSAAGEWNAVCTLLEAPLPQLTSRLLADTDTQEQGEAFVLLELD